MDEIEFIAFLNRCAKHALASERNPRGVDIQAFIGAIKAGKFGAPQLDIWRNRVANTFEAQREALFGMLHLGLLKLLGDAELHAIITSASASLLSVHNAFNNFYNEPPFAQRLAGLTAQNRVPESAQHDFVTAVITCATGNPYGVSHAALPSYEKMIRSFSPQEIRIMLDLPDSATVVGRRIQTYPQCKQQFAKLVQLLDASSVPTPARPAYHKWTGSVVA